MSTTLIKGQKMDVTKPFPGLAKVVVELSWNGGNGLELDASAFLVGSSGKVNKEEDFIFYSNPRSQDGSVSLRNGSAQSQQFEIDLPSVPSQVDKIAFTLTIYDAIARRHTFAQTSNLQLRMINPLT